MFQYSSLAEKPFDQWEIATHWRPHHCDPHLDQTKFNDLLPLTIDGVLILDNSHYIQLCLLVFIFAFCYVLRLSYVSAKFARWIERYLWHWWHDTNGQRWRKEIFCPQLKLCEPQWRRIRRTKLTKVQNTNYKMCLSIPFQAKHKIKRKFPHSKLFYQSQSLEHTLRLFCKLMH